MTEVTNTARLFTSAGVAYSLALYSLVLRGDQVLLVELDDGRVGLPGGLYPGPQYLIEDSLRVMLKLQSGVVVGNFQLLGSYALEQPGADLQLSLTFGSHYFSGLMRPGEGVRRLHWQALSALAGDADASPVAREAARRAQKDFKPVRRFGLF